MRQPSEEEIRALEAEMEKLTVDDVLLQTIVTLINLGARKAGLAEGTQADLPQVKQAIDAARALLPLVEPRARRGARAGRATRCRGCRWPTCSSRGGAGSRPRPRSRSRRRGRAGPGAESGPALGSGAVSASDLHRR